ncbi:DegT/DnrJ/EryC1/StrS family aminotransferase [bacterium SCSIO 12827]|nr:DegT/DnrJ/EryC1/StrS family aminotransferase [bacterium SCSIO 12827]
MSTLPTNMADRLAILGGTPVRGVPMPARLAIAEAEEAMVKQVMAYYRERKLDPGYQGHFEDRYCQAFAEKMGGGFADAVATGTAALYVAIAALDLPKGSEVLVSPITDPGSLSAIILNGLTPRLTDSKPGSYNMGPNQFLDRISDSTSAVMVVHAAGQATEIDAITAEAHARKIKVIEDCSQAHFATCAGKPVGSFGDIAAFSTMYRKAHITGASGGLVFTRDEEIHRMALAHADRGKPRWQDEFDDRDPSGYLFPALNLHSDEISCGVGLISLARLDDTIARRRAFVDAVASGIDERSRVCTPSAHSDADSPFFYPVFIDPAKITCTKTEFALAVRAEGIDLNPDYKYLATDWPWLRSHLSDGFDCPNARRALAESFNLYLNENYGAAEADDTVRAILKVESHFVE